MIFGSKQIYFAGLLYLTGCSAVAEKQHIQPIAVVAGQKLFASEIKTELPHFSDKNDSLSAVHEYIDSWIKQQLLVSEAESNLSREESDVSLELEKYRQELLIYKYKNKRLQQVINQSVPEDVVLKYYRKNKDKFVLTQPVVKANYVVFPVGLNIPAHIRDILSSNNIKDTKECEKFIFKNARKFDNFKNNWIHLDYLLKLMSVSITDPVNFLKNQKIIERNFGNEIRIIAIKQYYLSGEQAPIDLIAPQIKGAVINKEKLDFLREIKDSLYLDALKYNKFKVFN